LREKRRRQRPRRTHSNEDGEEQTRFRWGSNDERDTLEELRHEELGDEGVGVAEVKKEEEPIEDALVFARLLSQVRVKKEEREREENEAHQCETTCLRYSLAVRTQARKVTKW